MSSNWGFTHQTGQTISRPLGDSYSFNLVGRAISLNTKGEAIIGDPYYPFIGVCVKVEGIGIDEEDHAVNWNRINKVGRPISILYSGFTNLAVSSGELGTYDSVTPDVQGRWRRVIATVHPRVGPVLDTQAPAAGDDAFSLLYQLENAGGDPTESGIVTGRSDELNTLLTSLRYFVLENRRGPAFAWSSVQGPDQKFVLQLR